VFVCTSLELLVLVEFVVIDIVIVKGCDDEVAPSDVDQPFIVIVEEVVPPIECLTTDDCGQPEFNFRLTGIINILNLIRYPLPEWQQFVVEILKLVLADQLCEEIGLFFLIA